MDDGLSLPVFLTHLDHVDEELRVQQLECVRNFVAETLGPNDESHILGGDMNSLLRSDYSDERWHQIEAHRRESQWEEPQTKVMTKLLHEWKYVDPFQILKSRLDEDKRQSCYPPPTCWANTRVDYILFSPQFEGTIQDYRTFDVHVSDHLPVLVTFDLKKKK